MRSLLALTTLLLGCSGPKPPPPALDAGTFGIDCPPLLAVSGNCQRDADCPSGSCIAESGAVAVDGDPLTLVCAAPVTTEDAACDTGADCGHGVCLVSGSCALPCALDADCGSGQVCRRAWARRGETATQYVAGCVARVVLPIAASHEQRAEVAHVSAAGPNAMVSLDAAPGLSVLLSGCAASVRARRLSTSSGEELFGLSAGVATAPPLNPLVASGRPLTVLLPSGSSDVTSPTGYVLELDSEGDAELSLITLRGAGEAGGEIQLELFYVGVPGWEPVGLEPPAEVRDALIETERLFGGVGLSFRIVGQHVLTGDLATRLAVLDEEPDGASPEREELFALSAGLRSASLPVFFVRAMDRGALGASGGIPGPQGVMATEGSGVAVAASVIGEERLALGAVLAHEIGHFLGLFHTSELDGSGVEALADTPTCGGGRDTDGDGVFSAAECIGFGAENLMFWSARAGGEVISAQQTALLRRAVLIHR